MLFTELRFFPFFALAFLVTWGLGRRNTARKVWLLVFSYVFYAGWDWRFLSLIIVSTLVDYVSGLRIDAAATQGARRRWLLCSMVANLGLLCVFKYYNFFIESAQAFSRWLGFDVGLPTLAVVLPVGISFFTFQTMSYSIDIYRRQLQPTRSLLDLAVFVGFFPQLVAGPIVRARTFIPQLDAAPRWEAVPVRASLVLFLVGFVKKACVADYMAPFVETYFEAPTAFDAASSWTAMTFYAVQIYCDFSGYSDMAIATSGLLGYELCENFSFPYLAGSITEFWRRWHMSLSTWLRDYLYIPLGGSRGGEFRTQRNLMLTMLLGGLWHGAAMNFVIWGGLHGLALMVHKAWKGLVGDEWLAARRVLGPLVTFWFVCVAWIFFRAGSIDILVRDQSIAVREQLAAGEILPFAAQKQLAELASTDALQRSFEILRSFVLLDSPGTLALGSGLGWIFAALALAHVLAFRRALSWWWQRLPAWAFAGIYGALFAVAVHFVAKAQAFIYFQF